MVRIPVSLKKCPLSETVFEIRFIPSVPSEMVISEVYLLGKDILGNYQDLPIMEIPAEIRKQDPNLKYVPCHEFVGGESSFPVRVGPRNISFHVFANYPGWKVWSGFIHSVMNKLTGPSFLGTVERTGLRYINFFEGISEDILDQINVDLSVRDQKVSGKNLQLRLEETNDEDKNFLTVTQIFTHRVQKYYHFRRQNRIAARFNDRHRLHSKH